jgi:hypothetical protein
MNRYFIDEIRALLPLLRPGITDLKPSNTQSTAILPVDPIANTYPSDFVDQSLSTGRIDTVSQGHVEDSVQNDLVLKARPDTKQSQLPV